MFQKIVDAGDGHESTKHISTLVEETTEQNNGKLSCKALAWRVSLSEVGAKTIVCSI
jgi:hypothetical protein